MPSTPAALCSPLRSSMRCAARPTPSASVSAGMRQLAARGTLGSVEVGNTEWVDTDTPADLALAESLMQRSLMPNALC